MSFSVSPSVTVREVDLTTTVPAITTPPAAIAGVFNWGPTNERVLISSEVELANVFGKPSDFNPETFFVAADFLSYSNALYVTRVVSDDAVRAEEDASTPRFRAKYFGELGNSLEVAYVSVSPSASTDPAVTNNFEDVLFDTSVLNATGTVYENHIDHSITFGSNQMSFTIPNDFSVGSSGAELKIGDVLRIGNEDIGFQDLAITNLVSTNEVIDANNNIEVFTYDLTFDRNYTLAVTDGTDLEIIRRWKYASVFENAPDTGEFHIVVIDRDGSITGQVGSVIERYSNLSTTPGAKFPDGSNKYYADVISTRSSWIEPTDNVLAGVIAREYNALASGDNGDNENTISLGKVIGGYDLYREGNEVDVSFILQGKPSVNIANYIIANLAEYRKDCVAFLSPLKTDVVNVASSQTQLKNIIAYRNSLQNSSYWFLDSGYKYRYDKYNDTFRWVPLNGDVAGLSSLVQPWESPAGYRKGRVRNVIKLAFNPNKSQRDQLYGSDVNPVMTQVGRGTVLFGDKTGLGTATGSAFTRINVRRLFITIEKAIATVSAQFLFEFNDEFTQNQFRQVVDPFLRDIQGRRGIIDFRVVSDSTVNTPQVIDSNTFRANIFVKPARSINFIDLTFIATRTGVEFEEIVGQQF